MSAIGPVSAIGPLGAVGLVTGVIAAFFVIGIGVGVIAVFALSALRYRRRAQRDDWLAGRRRPLGRTDDGVGWQEPPGPDEYGDGAGGYGDQPPRWPGG